MIQLHGAVSPDGLTQPVPQARLVNAAHEFEAQMMKELLKPLTSVSGLTGSEDVDSLTGSEGALGELASEVLGRSLSEHGGLGIANSIIRSLSQNGNRSQSAEVSEKLHSNPALRKAE